MDVDRDKINERISLNRFLKSKNVNIEEIKNEKQLLRDFCSYMVLEKGYNKSQIARILNINLNKLYYITMDIKGVKKRMK